MSRRGPACGGRPRSASDPAVGEQDDPHGPTLAETTALPPRAPREPSPPVRRYSRNNVVAGYILFSICLLLSVLMMWRPVVFTKFSTRYFQVMFKRLGYDVELRPTSPNKPEKIVRIWGFVFILFFLFMLILVYVTTNQSSSPPRGSKHQILRVQSMDFVASP